MCNLPWHYHKEVIWRCQTCSEKSLGWRIGISHQSFHPTGWVQVHPHNPDWCLPLFWNRPLALRRCSCWQWCLNDWLLLRIMTQTPLLIRQFMNACACSNQVRLKNVFENQIKWSHNHPGNKQLACLMSHAQLKSQWTTKTTAQLLVYVSR